MSLDAKTQMLCRRLVDRDSNDLFNSHLLVFPLINIVRMFSLAPILVYPAFVLALEHYRSLFDVDLSTLYETY
jgi:hypothetical protein